MMSFFMTSFYALEWFYKVVYVFKHTGSVKFGGLIFNKVRTNEIARLLILM